MKKKHMEIYRADVMGFCYGVKRAMKIAEKGDFDLAKAKIKEGDRKSVV